MKQIFTVIVAATLFSGIASAQSGLKWTCSGRGFSAGPCDGAYACIPLGSFVGTVEVSEMDTVQNYFAAEQSAKDMVFLNCKKAGSPLCNVEQCVAPNGDIINP